MTSEQVHVGKGCNSGASRHMGTRVSRMTMHETSDRVHVYSGRASPLPPRTHALARRSPRKGQSSAREACYSPGSLDRLYPIAPYICSPKPSRGKFKKFDRGLMSQHGSLPAF